MGDLLRCFVGDNIKTWDSIICQAEFAHNRAANLSTSFSQFQVVYGSLPRCLADLARTPDRTRFHGQTCDFVEEFAAIHELVHSNLETSTTKQKSDLVWAVLTKDRFKPGTYNKLKSRKIGPLTIAEKINNNAYRLQLPPHMNIANVFNVKHLVPYVAEDEAENKAENSRSNFFLTSGDMM